MMFVGYLSSRFLGQLSTFRNFKKVCQNHACGGIMSDTQPIFPSSIGSGKCSFMTMTNPLCNSKNSSEETFEITFIRPNGEKVVGKGKEGDSLLDVVNNNDLDLDGYGKCDGMITCGTCHVLFTDRNVYDTAEPMNSFENWLFLEQSLAPFTDLSRLGCQVKLSKKLGNFQVKLPDFTRDQRES
ncbi:hypothetical protein LSTR_LSTR002330 [Laodelphax striatellus]|uniref:2Fe-2S ferredoxin-type domain-containing protein n=1 Tax=Laodelphax striatellus TaxID=195883 RepID=A0A482X217_LAOST|nr:hypothetical protein LSTR_LSTR002330 [Laodelphax striatellus]